MGISAKAWITCCISVAVSGVMTWILLRDVPVLPDAGNKAEIKGSAPAERSEMAAFAGHLKCAECHAEIHQSHMPTPHSRTFSATRDSADAQRFCDSTHPGGDGFGEYQYTCDPEGLAVSLNDRFPGHLFPLDFAVGSGAHAVTFLTLLKEGGETVGVEHRMSWFRHGEHAGITPGQSHLEPQGDVSSFGKIVRGAEMHRCVNCHVTTGRIVDAEIRDLTPGIHCERCHGPGAAHADAAAAGDLDSALNAIRSRWTSAEEVAMCGDCHRMPHDVVGDRLTKYPNSLVRFQPIGLLQSRCYLNSPGALRCTTCHDAHAGVHSRSLDRQTESCLSCHSKADQTPCAARETAKCIDCHMPAIELVPGVSFHDHWIRVRNSTPLSGNSGEASDHGSLNKDGK